MSEHDEKKDAAAPPVSGKPTVEIATLDVILGLLRQREGENGTILSRLDALAAKSDALRAEGDKRGAEQSSAMVKLEGAVDATRNEVKNLARRMSAAEEEIVNLKDGHIDVRRKVEETTQEHRGALDGAIEHVKKIDDGFAKVSSEVEQVKVSVDVAASALKTDLEGVKTNDEQQNKSLAENSRVNKALCEVLGVNYQAAALDPKTSGSMIPASDHVPKATLPSLARDNKLGAAVALVTFLTVLGQIVLKSCN